MSDEHGAGNNSVYTSGLMSEFKPVASLNLSNVNESEAPRNWASTYLVLNVTLSDEVLGKCDQTCVQ